MKFLLFTSTLLFTLNLFASPSKPKVISVDNEIKVIQNVTPTKKTNFKVIKVKNKSVFEELGYKNGDVIKDINGTNITDLKQLKAALDSQATEWENTTFDNDFSEGEVDIDDTTFDELEAELIK